MTKNEKLHNAKLMILADPEMWIAKVIAKDGPRRPKEDILSAINVINPVNLPYGTDLRLRRSREPYTSERIYKFVADEIGKKNMEAINENKEYYLKLLCKTDEDMRKMVLASFVDAHEGTIDRSVLEYPELQATLQTMLAETNDDNDSDHAEITNDMIAYQWLTANKPEETPTEVTNTESESTETQTQGTRVTYTGRVTATQRDGMFITFDNNNMIYYQNNTDAIISE